MVSSKSDEDESSSPAAIFLSIWFQRLVHFRLESGYVSRRMVEMGAERRKRPMGGGGGGPRD